MKKKSLLIIGLTVFILILSMGLLFLMRSRIDLSHSFLGISIPYFSSSRTQLGKGKKLPWKEYVDNKHGFSLEIPSDWQGSLTEINIYEKQEGFLISTETLDPCIDASEYIQKNIAPYANIKIEPLENSGLDGFVVMNFHLDNITPGPEALIFNCPYLIRLGFNPESFQNADIIFKHIISSVKVWSPVKDSQM
jgi:hypothetical protein